MFNVHDPLKKIICNHLNVVVVVVGFFSFFFLETLKCCYFELKVPTKFIVKIHPLYILDPIKDIH